MKKRVRGSLTVEASIVMFLVTMLLACMVLFFPILQKEMANAQALYPVCREGGCFSVVKPEGTGGFLTAAGNLALQKRYRKNAPLCVATKREEGSLLQVIQRTRLPFPEHMRLMLGKNVFYVRHWQGFRREEDGSDYVYITKTGKVYHRSSSCYHLLIHIKTASLSRIESYRNQSGAKYYPCETCGKSAGETVYITTDGNRYHSRKTCRNLLRFIKRVHFSEVKGQYRPCKDCAGGEAYEE